MATVADLTVRLSAQIAEFQKSFTEASKDVKKFTEDFEGQATRAAAIGTFFGNIATDLAKSFASGLASTVKDAVRLSSEFNNAFIGLSSIAAAFGQDVGKVKDAAKSLSADGLLPLKDSATGLKNLLAAGFNLDESVKLMGAFKDSAAFGRQAALSFGDAVRSATEGVKNGNSAVVDNAGVTKNLSVILKEAGFQMQDLADKTKGAAARQALYNGLLRETAAQSGDAAKLANTYTGQLTALNTAYETLLATWGDAITQNKTVADAIGAVASVLRDVTGAAADNRKAFLFVSDAVVVMVKAFAALIGAVDDVQGAFFSAQSASDKFFAQFTRGLIVIATVSQKFENIQRFTDPLFASEHAEKAKHLGDQVVFLQGALTGFTDHAAEAEARQGRFSAALTSVQNRATALAATLAETRGQVVSFGESGTAAAAAAAGTAAGVDKADGSIKGFSKSLAKLTADIDLAQAHGTPLAELMRLFGSEASKSTDKAHAWGIGVAASVERVAAAFDRAQLTKEMQAVGDAVRKIDRELQDFSTKDMQAEMKDLAAQTRTAIDDVAKQFDKFEAKAIATERTLAGLNAPVIGTATGFGAGLSGLGFTPALINSFGLFGQQAAKKTTDPIRQAFLDLGRELPELIARGFQQGGVAGAFAGAAQGAATAFGRVFTEGMKRTLGDFSELTTGEQLAGIGALAAGSFVQGFQTGLQGGGGAVNLGLAFGQGFLSGFMATGNPYIGLAAGAIQFFGTIIGGAQSAREETQRLIQTQRDLVRQYGGTTASLAALIDRAGGMQHDFLTSPNVHLEGAGAATLLTDARLSTEEFNAAVGDLNDALAAYDRRLKAIASATDAVNARTGVFAKQFAPLVAAKATATEKGDATGVAAASQAMQELAQRTQPEFERLGLFVRDTFAGIVKETGSAIRALQQLAPSFEVLKSGVADFGLSSTAVIDSLLGNFALLNDAAFKPLFENIEASGQLFEGLFDAQALSPETFQAIAADIGQSIQEIINKGGDIGRTFALAQPQLQALWEAQQTFGNVTDQTTQSILAQAEAQGLVGNQFRSTQEKTLAVLLAIADVFGADIPEGIRATATAATDASATIEKEFQKAATSAGQDIDHSIGGSLRNLGGVSQDSADTITRNYTDCWKRSGATIDGALGGPMRGLVAVARTTTNDANAEFSRLHVPDLTARVSFETEGFPSVPALASGGIVRRPTLALIGESGPEAVIPLSRLSAERTARDVGPRIVFEPGAVVLQGIDGPSIERLVDSGSFADALERQILHNPRGLKTAVRRATGVTS